MRGYLLTLYSATILGIKLRSETKSPDSPSPATPATPAAPAPAAPVKPAEESESLWTKLKRFLFPSKAIKFCDAHKGKDLSDPTNAELKGFMTANFNVYQRIANKCEFKTADLTFALKDPADFPPETTPDAEYEKTVIQKLFEKANEEMKLLDAKRADGEPAATAASASFFCGQQVGKTLHGKKGFKTADFKITGNTTEVCKFEAGSVKFDLPYEIFPIDETSKAVKVDALIQKLFDEAAGERAAEAAAAPPPGADAPDDDKAKSDDKSKAAVDKASGETEKQVPSEAGGAENAEDKSEEPNDKTAESGEGSNSKDKGDDNGGAEKGDAEKGEKEEHKKDKKEKGKGKKGKH